MEDKDREGLKQIIDLEVSKNALDFESIIQLISNYETDKVKMNFYSIKFDSNKVREEDFLKIISEKIVRYTLFQDERIPKDPDEVLTILNKAKNKFSSGQKPSGDIGELILYFILESKERAIQVLNKIALKTSKNVPYFGLDAVHLSVGEKIKLYYGESKLHKDRSSAIDSSIKSFEEFYEDQGKEDKEIDLISNFIDGSKFGDYKKKIIDLLNPYCSDKKDLMKVHAIFIGYQWDKLNEQSTYTKDIEKQILSDYAEEIKKISDKVVKNISESKIKDHLFKFYFLPFSDVEILRTKFKEKVGMDG